MTLAARRGGMRRTALLLVLPWLVGCPAPPAPCEPPCEPSEGCSAAECRPGDGGQDAGILVDAGVVDAGGARPDAGGADAGAAADGGTVVVEYVGSLADGGGTQVEVRWAFPPTQQPSRVRVMRRLNQAPTAPDDSAATLIYEGPGSSARHAVDELLPDVPASGFTGAGKPPLAARPRSPRVYEYRVFPCTATACEPTGPQASFRRSLTEALRRGGYVIFWRHASASTCGDDFSLGSASSSLIPGWWRVCRSAANPNQCGARMTAADGGVEITQPGPFARQLTDPPAATEIAAIQGYLQRNTVPFSEVRTSEFCRCSETARGYFSHLAGLVREDPALTLSVYGDRCPNVLGLTTTPPPAGANVALVSHSGMGCPTDQLAWSQAVIYRPRETQTVCPATACGTEESCVNGRCWRRELIGTLHDDEWAGLVPAP